MILTNLKIHQLRNIDFAQLELHPNFNFISGSNGSGKTSILEAFYLLGCGHSFRCRENAALIAHDQKTLTIFSQAQDEQNISIQKSRTELTQVKLNHHFCGSTSQLAHALPCQIFYADIFQIIDAGPTIRRSLLDWGLFHVKPNYLLLLKNYKNILKQRNALLKMRAAYTQFIPWDQQLAQLAYELHELRALYFKEWIVVFNQVLQELGDLNCVLDYFKGWDKKKNNSSLETILAESYLTDLQKGYTQYGAHQADIIIEADRKNAKRVLSRGQQKIILIALKLAQGALLKQDCLYLFDDFSAELDEQHQERLMNYLQSHPGQYVITNISELKLAKRFSNKSYSSFLVDEGKVSQNT